MKNRYMTPAEAVEHLEQLSPPSIVDYVEGWWSSLGGPPEMTKDEKWITGPFSYCSIDAHDDQGCEVCLTQVKSGGEFFEADFPAWTDGIRDDELIPASPRELAEAFRDDRELFKKMWGRMCRWQRAMRKGWTSPFNQTPVAR